jgi:acetoin utilization protein AcuC
MKTAFLYNEDFATYSYGSDHPLSPFRLKLAYELIKSCGLLSLPDADFVEAEMADEEALLLFHNKEYVEVLKSLNGGMMIPGSQFFGIGPGDNPVFKGLFDWSRLVTGASLQAAALVENGKVPVAFNIAGGLHHAMAIRASGFCYINDPVIAIMSLLKNEKRVAYIDIDAHHGDGVQEAFYKTSKVLTISMHETGNILFPGTGFENEIGEGEGVGYSVNIPMPPSSDDELFVYAFQEVVMPLIKKFRPDFVVTQLGVDSFYNDPLAHLNFTNNGFSAVVRMIKEISPKWVALGGGGYNFPNVAKAWTIAWAIMNEAEIPGAIPEDFIRRYPYKEFQSVEIWDKEFTVQGSKKDAMREEVDRVIDFIRKNIFPKHGI